MRPDSLRRLWHCINHCCHSYRRHLLLLLIPKANTYFTISMKDRRLRQLRTCSCLLWNGVWDCDIMCRLRWSRTFLTTRSVTSVPVFTAAESLLRSSAPTWPVCSITVSRAGPGSTRRRAASSTSHWSRKVPTGHARCRSAGVKTCAACAMLLRSSRRSLAECGLLCVLPQ